MRWWINSCGMGVQYHNRHYVAEDVSYFYLVVVVGNGQLVQAAQFMATQHWAVSLF